MKLPALKVALLGWLFATSFSVCNAQTSCTCKPSPPGGITKCPAGEVAICGANSQGVCEGKCEHINTSLAPIPYLAALLSGIFHESISDHDLFSDRTAAKQCIRNVETANETHESVTIKFKGFARTVTIGLTEIAQSKLESAYEELEKGVEGAGRRDR